MWKTGIGRSSAGGNQVRGSSHLSLKCLSVTQSPAMNKQLGKKSGQGVLGWRFKSGTWNTEKIPKALRLSDICVERKEKWFWDWVLGHPNT